MLNHVPAQDLESGLSSNNIHHFVNEILESHSSYSPHVTEDKHFHPFALIHLNTRVPRINFPGEDEAQMKVNTCQALIISESHRSDHNQMKPGASQWGVLSRAAWQISSVFSFEQDH